jgi:serine/threonine protein kinase|uniref:Protein kinase domain-containing protein n=1 Tax=Ostreococcus mediterraneus TaxID=1486918 RepID=A0A7S0PM95_9CHLO|mmetsp:Transcript_6109/g.22047  ORF Transcript_6109/g.22047 Transcript_6109/m.22047 type:complete len:684 (+) Transcript_6109:297-2348(+)
MGGALTTRAPTGAGTGRRDAAGAGATRRARALRRAVRVVTNAGAKFTKTDFIMERQIGEGSFGVVYEGRVATTGARGLSRGEAVVMKRPKLTVEGAAELQEIESWMNDRVSRDAKGACAEFLGSFRVSRDEWMTSGANDALSKEGLWLVWRYQGDRTLAQYLAQPDYPTGLAKALLGRDNVFRGDAAAELEITQKAVSQLLQSLTAVHKAGLVHRDVKPHNLVLAEKPEPTFKVIDLGACACFRTGTNFTPDETIMDPKYAPPEEFLIPTDDAPDLKKMFGPIALAAGTTAWLSHKPDRFDMYSAGIVLMQLAMPSLRTNSGLQGFNRGLKKFKYDLYKWREANKGQFSRSKTAVLDAGDGAGWELAAELLRPRPYEAEPGTEATERPSAEEALKHRFFEVDPTELKVEIRAGGGENWMAETAEMLTDMFSLEKRIQRQQENIAKQSTTIQRLKDTGADAKTVAEEEKTLEKMRVGLQGLLRTMSFKEVEARTTMVTAATELKKAAASSGVEASKEYDGMITDLTTQTTSRFATIRQRAGAAVGLTRKRVGDSVSAMFRMLGMKKDTDDAEEDADVEVAEALSKRAAAAAGLAKNGEDPEAIRKRMESIQSEMNAVIAEMSDMESRLMEQQQQLEQQQRNLASFVTRENAGKKSKNGSKSKNGKSTTKDASADDIVDTKDTKT